MFSFSIFVCKGNYIFPYKISVSKNLTAIIVSLSNGFLKIYKKKPAHWQAFLMIKNVRINIKSL